MYFFFQNQLRPVLSWTVKEAAKEMRASLPLPSPGGCTARAFLKSCPLYRMQKHRNCRPDGQLGAGICPADHVPIRGADEGG